MIKKQRPQAKPASTSASSASATPSSSSFSSKETSLKPASSKIPSAPGQQMQNAKISKNATNAKNEKKMDLKAQPMPQSSGLAKKSKSIIASSNNDANKSAASGQMKNHSAKRKEQPKQGIVNQSIARPKKQRVSHGQVEEEQKKGEKFEKGKKKQQKAVTDEKISGHFETDKDIDPDEGGDGQGDEEEKQRKHESETLAHKKSLEAVSPATLLERGHRASRSKGNRANRVDEAAIEAASSVVRIEQLRQMDSVADASSSSAQYLVLSTSDSAASSTGALLWNLNSLQIVSTMKNTRNLENSAATIRFNDFSSSALPRSASANNVCMPRIPDAPLFFIAQSGKPAVHIFEYLKEEPRFICPLSEHIVALSSAQNAPFLAGASKSGKLYIWNTISGNLLRIFDAHLKQVNVLAFTQNNSFLISASDDTLIHVWNMAE